MFFQNTIIKRYLAMLNDEQVKAAWEQYKALFLNQIRQDNIHASKEEQFQEGFLRDLFVKTLGYTINPDPDFNLITEKKNETDSKKADGAIQRDGKVIGIIELKDHKTPNLKQVETQAFGYKNQHRGTHYVIISNFEKLRFYIDDATEYREWDLFSLKEEDFKELYFCLSWGTLSQDLPIKAKTESVSNEDQITQQLYKDYSAFKREVFADILKNNTTDETPKEQILLLFKKTQKLLDRLLFIFFAEDCELLPPNMILQIIGEWEQLKALDEYKPLYDRIKKYFGYLDSGNESKNIFAYNGGLFKPDEELDRLTISDEVLARFTRKLSEYDYASEVDVNILGHIFENSLSEIEEVNAQINAGEAPSVSKRKRDGVFYTPQYITKYIVENTVGRLCIEKKAELGIDEDEYFADKNRQMATKKRLLDQLTKYRDWLLGITICDPACGSGAFLNAALHFLVEEHKLINEMEAKVAGASIPYGYYDNMILENNLFGVDINEESVEIAKLALWLRTAQPHRKLSSLNDNIKCGNSLISDPEIAGDKAFNWQAEFPQVFAKGGFDIVIGNPPYVRPHYLNDETKQYLWKAYKTYERKADLYVCFIEKALDLVKYKGYTSYIVSDGWLRLDSFEMIRKHILHEANVLRIIDFTKDVFDSATVKTCIFVFQKGLTDNNTLHAATIDDKVDLNNIKYNATPQVEYNISYKHIFDLSISGASLAIKRKMQNSSQTLGELFELSFGIKTGDDERFLTFDPSVSPYCKKLVRGADINRWTIDFKGEYVIYQPEEMRMNKITARPGTVERFEQPKVLVRDTGGGLMATFDNEAFFVKDVIIVEDERKSIPLLKTLAALLNSKVLRWYYDTSFPTLHVQRDELASLPIPKVDTTEEIAIIVDRMLSLNKDLQAKRARFLQLLQNNLPEIKISGTLETFDTLDFAGFVAELKKQKIKLSLNRQDEWLDFFTKYKSDCNGLSAQIAATDRDIDSRVYALYGLTEEEIALIEKQ